MTRPGAPFSSGNAVPERTDGRLSPTLSTRNRQTRRSLSRTKSEALCPQDLASSRSTGITASLRSKAPWYLVPSALAWFQAYLPGEPEKIAPLIDRVERAGFRTLVLTRAVGTAEGSLTAGGESPPGRPPAGGTACRCLQRVASHQP
jgi:hypothetical protein